MARRGLSRDGGACGIWWFWHAVLGMLAVTAVTAVALLIIDQNINGKVAAAEAAHYTPPPLPSLDPPIVSIIGDSYTSGSTENSGVLSLWSSIIAAKHPDLRIARLGAGGSGYLIRGPFSDKSTFVERASRVDSRSKEVIFFGSRNDGAADPAKLGSAASTAYAAAKKVAPHAVLIVIGPPWVDSNPPAALQQDRDILEKVAKAAGAVWVDPLADNWFPTGSGMIGSDGVHPTDAGHAHLAKLIEPIIMGHLPS